MIRIRRYRPDDLARILKIEKGSFGVDAWPAALFEDYARACPKLFLVAEAEGAVAGYLIACIAKTGSAEIASIAVLPRYRGRHIATILLRSAIAKVRREEARAVGLMVRRDNQNAISLYRGFGFVRTATISNYYEDGATGWRMRLMLDGSSNP